MPGKEGFYWKLFKLELKEVGLHCQHAIMLTDYALDSLVWIDLSGRNNRIDLNTLRLFILPSTPNLRHLDVAHALGPESRANPVAPRVLISQRASDKAIWSLCDMKDLDFIDDFFERITSDKKSENITEADAKDWEDFWTNEDTDENGGN